VVGTAAGTEDTDTDTDTKAGIIMADIKAVASPVINRAPSSALALAPGRGALLAARARLRVARGRRRRGWCCRFWLGWRCRRFFGGWSGVAGSGEWVTKRGGALVGLLDN
jgi:hypothetical protein